MKKLLAVFLSSVIFLFSFSVFAFAGSSAPENLIDPDLRTWDRYQGTLTDSFMGDSGVVLLDGSKAYTGRDIYRLNFKGTQIDGSGPYYCVGDLNSDVELVAGKSYTFSFYLPNYQDLNLWISRGANSSSGYYGSNNNRLKSGYFLEYYSDGQLVETRSLSVFVGVIFGDVDDDDYLGFTDTDIGYIEINYDNFDELAGKTHKVGFVCPSYKLEPHICIMVVGLRSQYNTEINLSDLAFYDNDQTSAELKGIKGLLHSLYWDLFGGVCDDEDCPHSVVNNPHVSIFDKLVNLILYFDPDGNYENPFNGVSFVSDVSDYFEKLTGYVTDSVNAVTTTVDSASGMIHIFDLFTKRFSWVLGICTFTLAVIVFTRFIGL